MKIILSFLLLAFTNLLALDVALVPYVAQSKYDGDAKDKALIGGLYSKFTTSEYSMELNIESTKLDYNSTDNMKQKDFIVAYSQLISPRYKFDGALHYITSDNNQSDQAKVVFLGLQYFKKNRFDLGAEIAYSRYESTAIADDVRQIRIYSGVTFGDYRSTMGKFIAKVGLTMLYPKYTDSNSSLESSYSSYDLSLTQYKGAFINKISWWSGEELYGVRDRGFTVYNLNELHETGFHLSSRYSIERNMGLSLSYTKENFIDLNTNLDDSMERILLSFDYTIR